ncbi:MAG: 2-C-methyl-D-erythritol 4-phosphate cytidylyltransferase [Candidatus Omnitrophica bacterium]|nr:2-C-methyl-D-erythritol 4-phosphate cytidylyltransferase [Candidatus Omnitrophota bacterium]
MVSAIILAAGRGKRLNTPVPKPLVKIGNLPAIVYSLRALNRHLDIAEIIVVVSPGNQQAITNALKKYPFKKIKVFVLGGARRQDSVANGLKEVSVKSDWVLIHDSARPFIDRKSISKVIFAAKKTGAAILGIPVKATIKSVKAGLLVDRTVDRANLWEIQTPQVFKKELIVQAYKKYSKSNVTDDASLVEKLGKKVQVVPGSDENIKITTSVDLLLAGEIARRRL